MFRKMRRSVQELGTDECKEILENGSSGVLALCGDDGYPYAVPLNYAFDGGSIYYHCAVKGHKLDAVRHCDRASFCVVGFEETLPEKLATKYKSAIVFGRITVVDDDAEKRGAADMIAKKYSPASTADERNAEIDATFSALCILRLDIEHMTAKRSKY